MLNRTKTIVWVGGLVIGIQVVGGCSTTSTRWLGASQIRSVLIEQQTAWNEGDVEAFMQPYWKSPRLSFSSGGQVTRGWDETLAGYKRRYPTRDAMGQLTFGELEISKLGDGVALVLGRWHLDRDDPVGGAFSLVFRRVRGRWLIIHDHTSSGGP